ncbi:unnamed protein product [Nippostrongylus brasiliensis]|uniref:SCP domain-containing protein n=1 Tax=Nippostrongylus brasiliensis TaxID=27835 RepID=A0A0N4YWL7_NIPBR|nr:unnamed protein product [Nippostrongylus brasiliensis]
MWNVFVQLCFAALSVLPTYNSAQNRGAFDCTGTLSNPATRKDMQDYHNQMKKSVAGGDMHNNDGYIPQAGNMQKMVRKHQNKQPFG